ncbi:formylglycine-generating enzyme family protein [Novipirellula maiorica]
MGYPADFERYAEHAAPPNEHEIEFLNLPNERHRPFSIGRHPASSAFFRLFDPTHQLRDNDSEKTLRHEDTKRPCVHVNWFDAWIYCKFLHWSGRSCTLPHEWEWECAAKFGWGWDRWDQAYWWGNEFDVNVNRNMICCREIVADESPNRPTNVRSSPATQAIDPTGFGLCDIHGNVREWCIDPFPDVSSGYTIHPESLNRCPMVFRANRGGSVRDYGSDCRASARNRYVPSQAISDLGFRIVRSCGRT